MRVSKAGARVMFSAVAMMVMLGACNKGAGTGADSTSGASGTTGNSAAGAGTGAGMTPPAGGTTGSTGTTGSGTAK